jgi:hypothetical protein
MKPKPQTANEGPLKVDQPFDQAISNALTVKPPAGGWATYEAGLRKAKAKAKLKKAN